MDKVSEHEIRFIFNCQQTVYCGSPKNPQNDMQYGPVATKQRDISASYLLHTHATFGKSIRSLLRYGNSVIPTLFLSNLALKSTGRIVTDAVTDVYLVSTYSVYQKLQKSVHFD